MKKSEHAALLRVLGIARLESMITVRAPEATDRDEKALAYRLFTLLKNTLGKSASFVLVREWSESGLLHWHIGISIALPPEVVEKIRRGVLRLLKEPDNRRRVFQYGERQAGGDPDWPRFYLAKTEKKGVPVKVPPEGWNRDLLGPLFRSHGVRRRPFISPQKEGGNDTSPSPPSDTSPSPSSDTSEERESPYWSASGSGGDDFDGSQNPGISEIPSAIKDGGENDGAEKSVPNAFLIGKPEAEKSVPEFEEIRPEGISDSSGIRPKAISDSSEIRPKVALTPEVERMIEEAEEVAGAGAEAGKNSGARSLPELVEEPPEGFCRTCFYFERRLVDCTSEHRCPRCGNPPGTCCPF